MANLTTRFKIHIERFTEDLISPYIARLTLRPHLCSQKEINDAIWQTIVLQPFEVLILDSPLLQRLRYIKQLGVVHWVYPAAGHSRLEHSLGALHQTQRLIDSLNAPRKNVPHDESAASVSRDISNLLRLAALCHDIGHGFMSHVCENALDPIDDIQDLRLELARRLQIEKCSLSEAAAVFMLSSPAFRRLVRVAQFKTTHQLPVDWYRYLPNLIVGKPILDRYPLLHELISGPFDADKLDYMPRDATMAGVPSVVDIPRLALKVRTVEVPADKLPSEIAKTVRGGHPSYYVQGITLSGARTLDELMIGRVLLFDKVYRHHKVRAAEAMVANIVALLSGSFSHPAELPLEFNDNDITQLSGPILEKKLGRPIRKGDTIKLAPAFELSARLRRRELFVRAYAFSHCMPQDPFRDDIDQKRGLERLRRELPLPEPRNRVSTMILSRLKEMKRLLPKLIAPNISNNDLAAYVALDPPSLTSRTSEIARAYVITAEGSLLRFQEDSAESPAWSNAYLMTRDMGFVFSPLELASATYLACEAVFREFVGLRTPPSAMFYAKGNPEEINKLRVALTRKGFYSKLPNDLRAPASRLGQADIRPRIDKITGQLSAFEGLGKDGKDLRHAVRVTPERILSWLRQFPSDRDAEVALEMLEHLRIISRDDIHAAVRQFLTRHKEFRGAFLCPLGGPRDSSAIVTYYSSDLVDEFQFKPGTLEDALKSSTSHILFVDDFISSGNQAISIALKWMGRGAEAPLDEDHGPPLSVQQQNDLKSKKLGFLFVCGDKKGTSKLKNQLTTLCLDGKIFAHIKTEELPQVFDGMSVTFRSPAILQTVRSRFKSIGQQLLANKNGKRHSHKWIESRALGYGNNAYLVAFPYNVPTQTITLLWSGGEVDGWDWLPLIPRRKKI